MHSRTIFAALAASLLLATACTPARESYEPRPAHRSLPKYHVTMAELPDDRQGAALAAGGAGHLLVRERQPAYTVPAAPLHPLPELDDAAPAPCPQDDGLLQFDCSPK